MDIFDSLKWKKKGLIKMFPLENTNYIYETARQKKKNWENNRESLSFFTNSNLETVKRDTTV